MKCLKIWGAKFPHKIDLPALLYNNENRLASLSIFICRANRIKSFIVGVNNYLLFTIPRQNVINLIIISVTILKTHTSN